MADRDKIPSTILPRYKGLYKQVLEQQAPDQIAQSALRPLKESIKKLDNSPVHLINRIAVGLKPIIGNSLFRDQINWDEEHEAVDELEKETPGNLFGKECAARACHQVLSRLETGEQFQDVETKAFEQYILNIYDAQFHENVLYSPQSQGEFDQEIIENHLGLVRPHLEEAIKPLAEQLAKHRNVNSLRLSRQNKQPVDIYGGDITQGIIDSLGG